MAHLVVDRLKRTEKLDVYGDPKSLNLFGMFNPPATATAAAAAAQLRRSAQLSDRVRGAD